MEPLVPCAACARHVRSSERACPFCEAPLPLAPPPRALKRVSARDVTRAAIFAGAALLVPACGNEPEAVEAPAATLAPAVVAAPPAPTEPKLEPADSAPSTPSVVFAPLPPTLPPVPSAPADATAEEEARIAAERRERREAVRLAEAQRVAAERRRQLQQQQLQHVDQVDVQRWEHINARPYGAPPRRDPLV